MNQKVLGALRAIGALLLFTIASAIIGLIPDILTQIPYIGGLVTPAAATALTALALAYEHRIADEWGYNLPAGQSKVSTARLNRLNINNVQ